MLPTVPIPVPPWVRDYSRGPKICQECFPGRSLRPQGHMSGACCCDARNARTRNCRDEPSSSTRRDVAPLALRAALQRDQRNVQTKARRMLSE
jgi:hypothetical protein